MTHDRPPPVVMTIAGNDPSGGAGIAADIEAIAAMGCHAAPVITTLTVQDTRNATRVQAVDADLVAEQARAVLADLSVAVVKLGLLGNAAIAHAVAAVLVDHPEIPVVLDPVLIAGGGAQLAEDPVKAVMLDRLVPRALIVTPNSDEARALVPDAGVLDDCAHALVALGARFVLLKGAHEDTPNVANRLFDRSGLVERFEWPRLDGSYHGSGCTLASALAGLLARGVEPASAVHQAQQFVHDALVHGYRVGRGQRVPNRMFWAGGAHA